MSIYSRDETNPEWEPSPWPMLPKSADEQERGFHERSLKSIQWIAIPWADFPAGGILGQPKDWLISVDAAFYATHDGEELLLIDNTWFGWPDPPRWGLVSRPAGHQVQKWQPWGHFRDLPVSWIVPSPN